VNTPAQTPVARENATTPKARHRRSLDQLAGRDAGQNGLASRVTDENADSRLAVSAFNSSI
jgi:FXSXX-COOH protein